MAAKLTPSPSGPASFWAIADYFREAGLPWSPSTAGYELWREVQAEGTTWSVCMKVHAVPARSGPGSPVRFKASITLWPDGASRARRPETRARAWRASVGKHLEGLAYRGDWVKSPHGVFGDFWKDLGGPADVRREAKRLEKLQLPGVARGSRRARGTR